jgi:hypothetical protein
MRDSLHTYNLHRFLCTLAHVARVNLSEAYRALFLCLHLFPALPVDQNEMKIDGKKETVYYHPRVNLHFRRIYLVRVQKSAITLAAIDSALR